MNKMYYYIKLLNNKMPIRSNDILDDMPNDIHNDIPNVIHNVIPNVIHDDMHNNIHNNIHNEMPDMHNEIPAINNVMPNDMFIVMHNEMPDMYNDIPDDKFYRCCSNTKHLILIFVIMIIIIFAVTIPLITHAIIYYNYQNTENPVIKLNGTILNSKRTFNNNCSATQKTKCNNYCHEVLFDVNIELDNKFVSLIGINETNKKSVKFKCNMEKEIDCIVIDDEYMELCGGISQSSNILISPYTIGNKYYVYGSKVEKKLSMFNPLVKIEKNIDEIKIISVSILCVLIFILILGGFGFESIFYWTKLNNN